ncbi:mediator of RNA polymerase II transcription subunit 7 isoform X1 [Aplysia californica]|uniref:Mediator of RNA polymerase II transcription subunit 7 n=2 Tax=Aplysia californica TaxID=6500 RepID=A0ABM0K9J9_APLCA|nr:mediator of RNA polymerase II transcription subunit 7 isoform X1 [Aplysia californica]
MTDNQGVSAFPMPPMQYVNNYSDDNIKRGKAPQPPTPIQDSYSMFGAQYSADDAIIRPLEASGCRRLYPHNYDHKRELKKLNHSILVNFLDLLDVLIRAPESPKRAEKLEDINLLFINMHHLINEFRPHQARETLRVMMELQRNQRSEVARKFQEHFDKVMDLIQTAMNSIPEDVGMDSTLVSDSDLLNAVAEVKSEPMDLEACDSLDTMMCKIVDDMT